MFAEMQNFEKVQPCRKFQQCICDVSINVDAKLDSATLRNGGEESPLLLKMCNLS